MKNDVALTVVARVLTTMVAAASTILTARALGVEGRGDYYYVVTLSLLSAQVASLGLTSSNALLAARDRSLAVPLLVNSLWVSIILGPTIALAFLVGDWLVSPSGTGTHLLGAWVPLIASVSLFSLLAGNMILGLGEYRFSNVAAVSVAILQLLLLTVCFFLLPSIDAFLATTFVCTTVLCVVLARKVLHLRKGPTSSRIDIRLLRNSVGYAARAFLVLLAGYVLSRLPIIVLGVLGDTKGVGLASIAVQIADLLLIIPTSVALVLFPKLVKAGSAERDRKTLRTTTSIVVLMAIICASTALVADPVVTLLLGHEFEASGEALRWLLPGVVCLSAVNVLGQYFAAAGYPLRLVVVWAVAVGCAYAASPSTAGPTAVTEATFAVSVGYGVLALGMVIAYWQYSSHIRRVPGSESRV